MVSEVKPLITKMNKLSRLDALRRLTVLGTPHEKGFDNLTKLAAEIFHAPVVLLTLLDGNRVWVKSCYGIPLQEIPAEAAFYTQIIENSDCLVVPDTALDERFQAFGLAGRQKEFRFYAGAAIQTTEGHPIGALCILDFHPHSFWSEDEYATLKVLASFAADELELRCLRYREEERNRDEGIETEVAGSSHQSLLTLQMREETLKRLHLEAELRYAIEHRHLVLHYQPEVDLASKEVIGFEALIRWEHPQHGLIPPNEFIPIAEESGLILPLGEWGLREACRQICEWRSLAKDDVELRVSVNLSAKQFSSPDLPKQVSTVLAETGLTGTDLRLEVTESCLMSDSEAALVMLTELRELGVGLQMDDFGTGYSSLNYLHRFPFDTLKIDRSFIQDICESKHSWQIVRSIIDLARSLKLNVVAEGIETESQLKSLRKLGCRFGQGFLFAKPLPPAAITSLLQKPPVPDAPFYFQHGI